MYTLLSSGVTRGTVVPGEDGRLDGPSVDVVAADLLVEQVVRLETHGEVVVLEVVGRVSRQLPQLARLHVHLQVHVHHHVLRQTLQRQLVVRLHESDRGQQPHFPRVDHGPSNLVVLFARQPRVHPVLDQPRRSQVLRQQLRVPPVDVVRVNAQRQVPDLVLAAVPNHVLASEAQVLHRVELLVVVQTRRLPLAEVVADLLELVQVFRDFGELGTVGRRVPDDPLARAGHRVVEPDVLAQGEVDYPDDRELPVLADEGLAGQVVGLYVLEEGVHLQGDFVLHFWLPNVQGVGGRI